MSGALVAIRVPGSGGREVARAAAAVCGDLPDSADVWMNVSVAVGLLLVVCGVGWLRETGRSTRLGARNARLRRSRAFWVEQTKEACTCMPCVGTGGTPERACWSCHGAGFVLPSVAAARLARERDLDLERDL